MQQQNTIKQLFKFCTFYYHFNIFFKGKKLKIRSYQEFSHEIQEKIRNCSKSGKIRINQENQEVLDRLYSSFSNKNQYLTVMGIVIFLPVSLSYSPAPFLINTYLFFSFSAASAESRGPHLLQRKHKVKDKEWYDSFYMARDLLHHDYRTSCSTECTSSEYSDQFLPLLALLSFVEHSNAHSSHALLRSKKEAKNNQHYWWSVCNSMLHECFHCAFRYNW